MNCAVIVLNVLGCALFSTGVYMTENQLEHRMSLSLPTPIEYNLDEVVIECEAPTEMGVARMRTAPVQLTKPAHEVHGTHLATKAQPMAHMQSSVPLRWMSKDSADEALEFSTLKEHKVKSPEMRETKSGNGWKVTE